jgi:hypothetical protein
MVTHIQIHIFVETDSKKRGRDNQEQNLEPPKRTKEDFEDILAKYRITLELLEGNKSVLLERFCFPKDLSVFTIQVCFYKEFSL